ncbi:hypothetical protein K0817_008830 [Microbacterium sp. HD4P20]|uniref:poly(ethylene terephthalate) hydrolase family protein n=1 Tax=Microbacterium sp. HD4P20 TaxID=2864874 RepID=UPI001C63CA64|nr:hypothetical protein [Microbacterium sp. HD4P20]MCP2636667.1 hypothetical protein [Microbacterium sp. HD4P20]
MDENPEALRGADDARAQADVLELLRLARGLARRPDRAGAVLQELGFESDGRAGMERILGALRDVRAPVTGVVHPGESPQWQPSVLAPVFYGHADHGTADGLPGPVRVFYPSVDGSPQDAQMLTGVGRYPVVLFLHGQCAEPEHYLKWDLVPMQLARSGYVVIVPKLSSTPPFGGGADADFDVATSALTWLRTQWEHRAELMPRPMTGVVGHSWGALLGGAVAEHLQAQGSISAFASLSGGWMEWPPNPPRPLDLDFATLFAWGTGQSDLFAQLSGPAAAILAQPRGAVHHVAFRDGEHFDYFREGSTTCGRAFRGPCSLMRPLAADFVTTFLSHYMPPQRWSALATLIPHSLVPPPLDLTPQQEFFAGGHLTGFAAIPTARTCSVTHGWHLPPFLRGSIVLGAG